MSNNLTPAQLDVLKLMAHPMSDADLQAIKNLICRYFADKLTAEADAAWDKNGWTDADAARLLQGHFRKSK